MRRVRVPHITEIQITAEVGALLLPAPEGASPSRLHLLSSGYPANGWASAARGASAPGVRNSNRSAGDTDLEPVGDDDIVQRQFCPPRARQGSFTPLPMASMKLIT